MLTKIVISLLIFLETIIFCYTPKIAHRFAKYRTKWLNIENINNATSGALLSLAITHLLPEGFQYKHDDLILYKCIDLRGFIVIFPILLLVTVDFLAGHHCGNQATEQSDIKSLNNGSLLIEKVAIKDDLDVEDSTNRTIAASDHEGRPNNIWDNYEIVYLKFKQILTSRPTFLLLSFYGHSILEGSLLGCESGSTLWAMAFGILAHKWAECLLITSTVTNLLKSELVKNLCILSFSLCVPIGMLIGYYSVPSQSGTLYTVFSLLAVGFFIYLSFELFTGNTGHNESPVVILWTFYILGAIIMSVTLCLSNLIEIQG